MHKLILSGQTLRMVGARREIASDSIQQVLFTIEPTEDWRGFTLTAQFTQAYETTDVLVVNNQFHLPPEIRYGEFSISIYGSNGTIRRNTTIPLNLFCNKSGYTPHGTNTPELTPSLFDQVIKEIRDTKGVPDWLQDDETHPDYIKNKPDLTAKIDRSEIEDEDALELSMESGLIDPVAADDGSMYTDENGVIYSL